MLKSECIECKKIYNKLDDGRRIIDVTHGICPTCFEKIREFRKNKRGRVKKKEEKNDI